MSGDLVTRHGLSLHGAYVEEERQTPPAQLRLALGRLVVVGDLADSFDHESCLRERIGVVV